MKRVFLSQVNNLFSRQVFLPYSVGILQAFAQKDETIKENYDFGGFVFTRENIKDVVKRMGKVDVFGASNYIWGSRYTLALSKAVKEVNPNCLVVLGGPHTPVKSDDYFKENPFVDLIVHYEGEVSFKEILLECLENKPDYEKVAGLSVRRDDLSSFKTLSRNRLNDLSVVPSPYLDGVFDELVADDRYDFHPTQETNRGCVFSCSFCDWGSNVFAKMKNFPTEQLVEEFDWFGKRRMSLLYNADSNFAIMPRDLELTEKLIATKMKYGYPEKFRAAYAKNSNDKVFQISKMLADAGMSKGTTLSFQSMDDNVLDIVKRKNIKIQDFSNLIRRYREAKIPTYTELIIGLPGESYESFVKGIDTLLNNNCHDSLSIYSCEVLPNSELNDENYKRIHGIVSAKTPVLHFHATDSKDEHTEHYEIVVETKTLPPDDWLKCQLFAWVIQSMHCLGLTQKIALYCHHAKGISYRKFYEDLLEFAVDNPWTVIGRVYTRARAAFINLRNGYDWGWQDKKFGDIVWPVEEGAFLSCILEKEKFYDELMEDVTDQKDLDVFRYQRYTLKTDSPVKLFNIRASFNVHEYLEGLYLDNGMELIEGVVEYKIFPDKVYDDFQSFAREVCWFGRKGGTFFHKNIQRVET